MSRSPVLTQICVTSISRDQLACISFVSNRSRVLHSRASPVVYSPAVNAGIVALQGASDVVMYVPSY